ncbi:hypothetical protein [Niabella beijingensis]|uniref:hypothetical protein n=1 Tax=Niabella beijingensis TaxID=2872700 RepID=UPI001CBE54BC|nr:hypothetical protein [Niabella beijingensis]MBZ4190577.1 hypothetical protein [Niabella beijingensis]
MQTSRTDLKKLRSAIFLQYGIELDETSLTILAILLQEVKRQFMPMHTKLDEMATQIQYSKKSLQVDPDHPRWQAFWHGMGQWGLGFILAVIAAFTVFAIGVNKEREEKKMIQQELAWYKEHYKATQKTGSKTSNGTIEKKSRQKNKQFK